jgi:hypothetical protein
VAKCAECPTLFKPTQVKQLFCSGACKQRFHNRSAARGKTLVPLLMASRQGRNTELGRYAQGEWARLAARYTAEDKAAGRMSMHAFLERQQSLGLLGANR